MSEDTVKLMERLDRLSSQVESTSWWIRGTIVWSLIMTVLLLYNH